MSLDEWSARGTHMSKDNVTLKFWRADAGERMENADEFECKNFNCFEESDANLECAAEAYAEDFYHNRDGWEAAWPITLSIATLDGKLLGKVVVEMEAVPSFYGRVPK